MQHRFMRSFVSILASSLLATAALAQDGKDLVFPIGEDSRFHWEDLDKWNGGGASFTTGCCLLKSSAIARGSPKLKPMLSF